MFEFFDFIGTWLTTGIFDFFSKAIIWAFEKYTIWQYEHLVWALQFSWSIAANILSDFNISGKIAAGLSFLPPQAAGFVAYTRLPECINILVSGAATRFVLRFIPFV